MARFLTWLLTLVAGVHAFAEIQSPNVAWRADGTVVLEIVRNGTKLILRALAKDDDRVELKCDERIKDEAFKKQCADLKAIARTFHGFITVQILEDGQELGQLFIFEGSAKYQLITARPILDRAASLDLDLQNSLTGLQNNPDLNWDAIQCLRKLEEYFRLNPAKKLSDFALDVENKNSRVMEVARPVGSRLPGVRTPAPVSSLDPQATPGTLPPLDPPRQIGTYPPPRTATPSYGLDDDQVGSNTDNQPLDLRPNAYPRPQQPVYRPRTPPQTIPPTPGRGPRSPWGINLFEDN